MKYGWRNNDIKVNTATIDEAVIATNTVSGTNTSNKVIVSGKLPMQYVIPLAIAAGTGVLMTGEDINANGTSAYGNADLLIQPPYAMQLSLNWNASGSASDADALLVAGESASGASISESLVITSAASGTIYSSNAFAKIDSITPNAVSPCTDIGLGLRACIGLPYPINAASDIISYACGGIYGTANVDSITISSAYNTLVLPTMTAGSAYSIVYKTELQA